MAFVCDYAGKTIKVYRNGTQFGLTKALMGTPQFPSSNRSQGIGATSSHDQGLKNGSLDEVRIYNRGLSAEEISAQYTSTKGKFGL